MIPAIDLGAFSSGTPAQRKPIAELVDATCRETGFLLIENHGVANAVSDAAWLAARQFFELPLEAKLATKAHDPNCPRGYFPLEQEMLARTRGESTAPDPKEAFSSGPPEVPAGHEHTPDFDFFYGPNRWPAALPGFAAAWLEYYHAMESLGARIMTLLAAALSLDDDYFARFHNHHVSALRGINYPATPAAAGYSRAGAHSDYGSITILRPDPDVGGLEVMTPDGNWLRIPSVDDALVVNIGDLMAYWTNNRWKSTLHRVVAPGEDPVPRRQSIAYFMNPNYDAEIRALPTCCKGAPAVTPVTAGQYLIGKFRAATVRAGSRRRTRGD